MDLRPALALASGLLLTACFDPKIQAGLPCGPSGECPNGQSCYVEPADGSEFCVPDQDPGREPNCAEGDLSCTPIDLEFGLPVGHFGIGIGAHQLIAKDVSGDSIIDLIVASNINGTGLTPAEVTVLHGSGDGGFEDALRIDANYRAVAVAVGDLGGGTGTDIAFVAQIGNNGDEQEVVVVHRVDQGDGRFTVGETNRYPTPGTVEGTTEWRTLELADISGDGRDDLLLGTFSDFSTETGTLVQAGDGGFSLSEPGVDTFEATFFREVADINQDGLDDFIAGGEWGLGFRLQDDSMQGSFGEEVNLPQSSGTFGGVVADLNHDQRLDIFASDSNGELFVHLQDPDVSSEFLPPTKLSLGNVAGTRLATADFNGDGHLDLVGNYGEILLGNGQANDPESFFRFTTLAIEFDELPYDVAAADFNRDGKVDVAIVHLTNGAESESFVRVFLQK